MLHTELNGERDDVYGHLSKAPWVVADIILPVAGLVLSVLSGVESCDRS